MDERLRFSALDYIVFVGTMSMSLSIGVVFAILDRRRKRNTPEHYFLAGRKVRIIPVALSFVVTFQSSILVIGFPSEAYAYGMVMCYYALGYTLATLFVAIFIVPLVHPLKMTSVYQYFKLRYNDRCIQYMTLTLGVMFSVFYMGTVTYGACIALEVVMGLPYWTTILIYTIVTTIYTSIGGIKAVIWTDVFQFLVMVTGIIAMVVKATIDVGGFREVYKLAETRFVSIDLSLDPRIRYTVWNLSFGSIPMWLVINFMQPAMQRIYSTPTVSSARNMYFFSIPIYCFVLLLTIVEGVAIFAYYVSRDCDIIEGRVVDSINAIVPFSVLQLFHNLPGLPGLFIASISSAALSTLSSCLSGLSALTYIDIIQVHYPNISTEMATTVSKIMVLIYGLIAMGMAFMISVLPGSVMAVFQSFMGCLDGPICAIFLLSMMFRRATTTGLICGTIVGVAVPLWINMGRLFSDISSDPYLPSGPTDQCSTFLPNVSLSSINASTLSSYPFTTTMTIEQPIDPTPLQEIYSTSFVLLSPLSFIISMLTGITVSLFTSPPVEFDDRCIFSFRDHFVKELFGKSEPQPVTEEQIDFLQKDEQL